MDRIRTIVIHGKEIMAIDYCSLKEADMIQLAIQAKAAIKATDVPKLIITNFKDTFVTSPYVRFMEKESVDIKHLIAKNALIGLNTPKLMILKGFNLLVKTDFRAFATEKGALEYLTGETVELHESIFPLLQVS